MSHAHFDFAALPRRERYKLLIGSVISRPVALVTTRGRDGRANAGPFGFFNVLTHDPAVVAAPAKGRPCRAGGFVGGPRAPLAVPPAGTAAGADTIRNGARRWPARR